MREKMSNTKQAHFTNAVVRMTLMAKILQTDSDYFMKGATNSTVKQALRRIKDAANSNINSVIGAYNTESQTMLKELCSDEKAAIIHNIISRISILDMDSLSELENQIIEVTKVEPVNG